MSQTPRFILAGTLTRDYYITHEDEPVLDVLGGDVPYAAAGLKLWEPTPPPGLLARVGEDFPQAWLDDLTACGFDTRGVHILPENVDVRNFHIYKDKADAFIVGSYFKKDGHWDNEIDGSRVNKFLEAAK